MNKQSAVGLFRTAATVLLVMFLVVKPESYYEFIGVNDKKLAEIRSEADAKAHKDGEYIKLLNVIPKIAKTAKEIEDKKKPALALLEKLKAQFFTDALKPFCQTTRETLLKAFNKAQKDLETADVFDRDKKAKIFKESSIRYKLSSSICNTLLDAKNRAAYDQMLAQGDIFGSVQANIEAAMHEPPSKKILLNHAIGEWLSQAEILSQLGIPGPATKIFNQNIELRAINFLPRPVGDDIKYGLGFSGLIALNNFETRISVYMIKDVYDYIKFSFTVHLPEFYKISSLFPSFTYLDTFQFPKAKFIIANFDGRDHEGFPFERGFNFGAEISLEGPFKILNDIKERSSYLKSLVFESSPIILSGVIPKNNILQTKFEAVIPMRIGVDLREIGIIPKALSDVINRVTTDDFKLEIVPLERPAEKKEEKKETFDLSGTLEDADILGGFTSENVPKQPVAPKIASTGNKALDLLTHKLGYRLKVSAGAIINLGTQSNPIKLGMSGDIIPFSKSHPKGMLSVTGSIENMLELKWLALGNARLSFDFDPLLLTAAAALSIPFTGIGIAGQIDLGVQGDARVKMKAAGGLRVKAGVDKGVPLLNNVDLMFDLSAENIRLANIASYATHLASRVNIIKKHVDVEHIPNLTFKKLRGYCSFTDTTIAGRDYRAGITLAGEFEFFDRKAGLEVSINDKFMLAVSGYFPHLDWKVKGTEVFRLTGLSSGHGPSVAFRFDPANPLQGQANVEAVVSIPALMLKQKVDFKWDSYKLHADLESELTDFSVVFGITMNMKEGTASVSKYDELFAEVNTLYESADQQHSDVVTAKRMIDSVNSFMQLKEYNKAQSILTRAKELLEKNQKNKNTLIKIAGSQERLYAQIEALRVENEYLLEAMKSHDLTLYSKIEPILTAALRDYNYDNNRSEMGPDQRRNLSKIYTTLSGTKRAMQKALGRNLKQVEDDYNKKIDVDAKSVGKKSPLLNPIEGLKQRYKEGTAGDTPFLLAEKEIEVDSLAKWQKLAVKFGFKGDFGAFLNKYAVQFLQKMRDNSLKKLDQINEKIASLASKSVDATEQEIVRTKEAIAKLQSKIDTMTKECSSLPYRKQAGCRAQILAEQAKVKAKQGYLHLLLRPGKTVVRGVTASATALSKALTQSNAVRSAVEGVLSISVAGMDMIAQGLSMINVTQVHGQYTWDDMKLLKLPKLVLLVARIELPEEIMPPMEIVLQNLQFDFKNPRASAGHIVQSILNSVIQSQQNKYIGYALAFSE